MQCCTDQDYGPAWHELVDDMPRIIRYRQCRNCRQIHRSIYSAVDGSQSTACCSDADFDDAECRRADDEVDAAVVAEYECQACSTTTTVQYDTGWGIMRRRMSPHRPNSSATHTPYSWMMTAMGRRPRSFTSRRSR